MVKGQRSKVNEYVSIATVGEVGIYGHVSIEKRKGALVMLTVKSFWNVPESSKGLYKRDISTIVSNYSKDCRF